MKRLEQEGRNEQRQRLILTKDIDKLLVSDGGEEEKVVEEPQRSRHFNITFLGKKSNVSVSDSDQNCLSVCLCVLLVVCLSRQSAFLPEADPSGNSVQMERERGENEGKE